MAIILDEFSPLPNTGAVNSIAPSASIWLCSGVPWDDRYTHVRKYKNRNALDTFLTGKRVAEFTSVSFIDIGSMNVAISYNQMLSYKANYMRFVNSPWDDKPHYAFIKSVSPVGANVCKITFELDVWNECQFDMILKPCFVEREIVKKTDDIIGKYTYPEELQLGDYIVNGADAQITIPSAGDEKEELMYCVASSADNFGETSTIQVYQNVPSGLYIGIYASIADLQGYIDTLISMNKQDSIVDAWVMPSAFADVNNLVKKTFTFSKKSITSIDGYVPKNNKLFTYPYSFLQMTNNSGQIKEFEYERFHEPENDDNCSFAYTVNVSPAPTLYCYPLNYKGVINDYGDSITFNGYPKIAFAVDSYKAWLAQNSNNLIISMATGNNLPTSAADWVGRGIMTLGQSLMGIAGAAIGGIVDDIDPNTGKSMQGWNGSIPLSDSVSGLISGNYQSQLQAAGIKGSISNTLPRAVGFDCISVFPVSITKEYAKIIDNFFSMYGYKICRIKTPSITGRSSWNFTKTKNCAISGNININFLGKLRQIFDNGVTVWHTDDIGNYGLENN